MSTTIVCRGLQSCLETPHFEPLTLRLTLVPPPPKSQVEVTSDIEEHKVQENNNDNNASGTQVQNTEFGGWSFLESLAKEEDKAAPYVHPLDKSSASTLSNKSLDICTEGLGSETGSNIGDESDFYSSSSSDCESRRTPVRERSRFSQAIHKKAVRRSFPPPLTSISGSDYVQFTPHREGGRLVIKAVKIANTSTCFEAERGNGRLRLQLKSSYSSCSSSCSNSSAEEDSTDDDEEEHDSFLSEKKTEGEMAIVENQRPCSWYKESEHKRMLNWKQPFLGVAI